MNEKLRMNYISLYMCILMIFFVGLIYLLLGKSMYLSIKIGFVLVILSLLIVISFNIITIINKVKIKNH